jgi:hypothetical protein
MSGQLQFSEVVQLVNRTKIVEIASKPVRESSGWELYDAVFKFQVERYPFHVLYLNSRITSDEAEAAEREVFVPGKTHVVYAPSAKPLVKLRDLFAERASRYWDLHDYLFSYISDDVIKYRQALQRPIDYVKPPISGEGQDTGADLVTLLENRHQEAGRVNVLLAEAGQGKTYTSKNVAAGVLGRRVRLPLHISSEQWAAMSAADLGSIWKTMVRCFAHYGSPIPWLQDNEEEFLRIALKGGLACVVFDGFDEYILRNRTLNVRDVLDSLVELAEDSGSTILVTSRTSFWDNAIADGDAPDVTVYRILPFRDTHAREFFNSRFYENEVLVSRATGLFRSLAHENAEFAGRGFVLPLIADLVAQGDANVQRPANADVAHWLFSEICAREEQQGQKLGISSSQQLRALQSFACEVAGGQESTTETLSLLVYQYTELEPNALQTVIHKMEVHPLITFSQEDKRWSFKQQQIQILLIAQGLLDPAVNGISAVPRMSLDASVREDLGTAVAGAMCLLPPDRQIVMAKQLMSKMGGIRGQMRAGSHSGDGPRLAGSIILSYIDRVHPGNARNERTALLTALSEAGAFRGLTFSGTIARLDLSYIAFRNCTFDGVTFVKCEFGPETQFDRCLFLGGSHPEACSGFEVAKWILRERDELSAVWMDEALVRGAQGYSARELENEIRSVMGRFALNQGLHLKTAMYRDMIRGTISNSPARDEVIETLTKYAIELKRPNGSVFQVRENARDATRFLVANNVLIGPLKAAFVELKEKLQLH